MSDAAGRAADACWVCGAADVRPWRDGVAPDTLVVGDLRVTDARYGTTLPLVRCRRCGFAFAPAARQVDLAAMYADLDDEEYVRTGSARRRQMRALVERAQRARPGARTLLDVGAGSGLLVDEARRAGLDAVGVEPSRHLSAAARAAGVPVLAGVLPHPALDGRRFDLVTLVDVVEHVADPVALLRRCAFALEPDGVLLVATPDLGSVAARVLGRRWWHFRLAHVGHFSRASLRRAAAAAGLVETGRGRPVWYLPVGYLAVRLQAYLPIARLVGGARGSGLAGRLAGLTLPLDLRDSVLVTFRLPSSVVRRTPATP